MPGRGVITGAAVNTHTFSHHIFLESFFHRETFPPPPPPPPSPSIISLPLPTQVRHLHPSSDLTGIHLIRCPT
ncbi:uncharacterized protein K489DRAFT_375429 [Dissoconium aciculare CBS 342.82]|uniref:Uncharacterized protein n=1 Tax=Dissoconium aciculare CBS 342.82 TaxID=1314786 RepID=A0A6J3MI07_9PEZI|nr:uncharacterized protein K489DRAFT_375429 [Dissoconium aciculare CBS 342.82]KAF1827339.1 hypothetical protein K489DRAFT_375429 [Dissoconium aciculare CBS 342.82]